MTPRERYDGDESRSWRDDDAERRASQSPDDFHVPYMREPGADKWRQGAEGPEASPDDFDVPEDDAPLEGERRAHPNASATAGSPEDNNRRRDSGRRRDPYDFSKAGPYSTPPPRRSGGPDYLGREDQPDRGEDGYVGLGPRGYSRSPERIQEDICERLTFSPYVDASQTKIHVDENGVVQLEGRVDSRRSKRIIEDICDTVFGVRDVRNELEIVENPRH